MKINLNCIICGKEMYEDFFAWTCLKIEDHFVEFLKESYNFKNIRCYDRDNYFKITIALYNDKYTYYFHLREKILIATANIHNLEKTFTYFDPRKCKNLLQKLNTIKTFE